MGADDPTVLAWAAERGRVTVTHDVSTMTRYAYDRAAAGEGMPGLVEVPPGLEIANVVDDLVLLAHASLENEWEGVVMYLLRHRGVSGEDAQRWEMAIVIGAAAAGVAF